MQWQEATQNRENVIYIGKIKSTSFHHQKMYVETVTLLKRKVVDLDK